MARGNNVFRAILPSIAQYPSNSFVNDIFLHALFARVTLSNNDTIEFETSFDPTTNTIELSIPDGALPIFNQIAGMQRGSNLKTFINWLIGSQSIVNVEDQFKEAIGYKELTYSGSSITSIVIYSDNTKAITLFRKTFTYSSNLLSQTVTTNVQTGSTLTKTFTYDGNNKITSISTT